MNNRKDFEVFLYHQDLQEETVHRTLLMLDKITSSCDVFNREELLEFLTHKLRTLSPAGYNHYIRNLKRYYKFTKFEGFDFVKYHKESPREKILLSDREIEAVIAVSPPPSKYGIFWTLRVYTGARSIEIRNLRQQDIDLTSGLMYLHHTKTKRSRKVPLLDFLISDLEKYLSKCTTDLLFPSPNNPTEPISSNAYMKDWNKRLKKLEIEKEVKPHSLRGAFITNSLGNGASLFAIQDIVGHTSADTTKLYYHGNIDLMRKAAQKLPMAQKKSDPRVMVEEMNKLMDEYLSDPDKYDIEEILEAKKHLYRAIKKSL